MKRILTFDLENSLWGMGSRRLLRGFQFHPPSRKKASIARAPAPGITRSPPRGVGTLVENSGWAARSVLAEALGLALAQALELARDFFFFYSKARHLQFAICY
jgi:hypothetical protein